jgi:hypothetical protein
LRGEWIADPHANVEANEIMDVDAERVERGMDVRRDCFDIVGRRGFSESPRPGGSSAITRCVRVSTG